ncbi:hypothetical protein KL930_005405, partial [Ogataea haglerorum]
RPHDPPAHLPHLRRPVHGQEHHVLRRHHGPARRPAHGRPAVLVDHDRVLPRVSRGRVPAVALSAAVPAGQDDRRVRHSVGRGAGVPRRVLQLRGLPRVPRAARRPRVRRDPRLRAAVRQVVPPGGVLSAHGGVLLEQRVRHDPGLRHRVRLLRARRRVLDRGLEGAVRRDRRRHRRAGRAAARARPGQPAGRVVPERARARARVPARQGQQAGLRQPRVEVVPVPRVARGPAHVARVPVRVLVQHPQRRARLVHVDPAVGLAAVRRQEEPADAHARRRRRDRRPRRVRAACRAVPVPHRHLGARHRRRHRRLVHARVRHQHPRAARRAVPVLAVADRHDLLPVAVRRQHAGLLQEGHLAGPPADRLLRGQPRRPADVPQQGGPGVPLGEDRHRRVLRVLAVLPVCAARGQLPRQQAQRQAREQQPAAGRREHRVLRPHRLRDARLQVPVLGRRVTPAPVAPGSCTALK